MVMMMIMMVEMVAAAVSNSIPHVSPPMPVLPVTYVNRNVCGLKSDQNVPGFVP